MLELNLLSANCTQAGDANVKSEWTGTTANKKEQEKIIDYSSTVTVLKDSSRVFGICAEMVTA